jgi:hypothetical protein
MINLAQHIVTTGLYGLNALTDRQADVTTDVASARCHTLCFAVHTYIHTRPAANQVLEIQLSGPRGDQATWKIVIE